MLEGGRIWSIWGSAGQPSRLNGWAVRFKSRFKCSKCLHGFIILKPEDSRPANDNKIKAGRALADIAVAGWLALKLNLTASEKKLEVWPFSFCIRYLLIESCPLVYRDINQSFCTLSYRSAVGRRRLLARNGSSENSTHEHPRIRT